jgi:hypothetical protein
LRNICRVNYDINTKSETEITSSHFLRIMKILGIPTYIVYHVASIKGKFMEEKMKEYLTFLLHFNCFED